MEHLRKQAAATILGVILVGLMGNAWSMYNDLQTLKTKEPITKEDIAEIKSEVKDMRKEMGELKVLIIKEMNNAPNLPR